MNSTNQDTSNTPAELLEDTLVELLLLRRRVIDLRETCVKPPAAASFGAVKEEEIGRREWESLYPDEPDPLRDYNPDPQLDDDYVDSEPPAADIGPTTVDFTVPPIVGTPSDSSVDL